MTSKSMKPQAAKPVSEEEKRLQIVRFLSQKREQFSLTILNGLCHNLKDNTPVEIDKDVVDIAVLLADKLMQKLYPIEREEKPKEETPAEKERKLMKGNLKEEICASDVCAYRGKNVCTIKRDEYCPIFKAKQDSK